jgi:hypothetical protein
MKMKDILGFLFLLAIFAVFFWFVDVRFSRVLVVQYETRHFSSVEGEVLSGTVTQWTGSKGTVHYHPSLTYRYQVSGQIYLGKRYRYDGHPSFYNEDAARQIVDAHPKGSEIEVYYNPDNPTDTVLSQGLDTADLAIPFVFGALNLLLLSLLIKLGKEIDWRGKGKPFAGGVRIIDDRMTTRVRLPRYQPDAMGLLVALVLSFMAGIIFQNALMDYPPVATGLLTLMGISIVSMTVYFFLRRKNESGFQDLVIDEGARAMELPLTYKRREKMPLTFNDVTAVAVEKIASRRRSGANSLYAVRLQLRAGPSQILTTLKQDNAESFAAWLREKLGMKTEVPEAKV